MTLPVLRERLVPLLPYVITAALFAAGAYALYHLLAEVSLREVMGLVRHTPSEIVGLALLCTFGGFSALIGYDWSALRYIRKSLPFPVVATGGFLGYAIGNTVGVGPVTGGAVRYRVYSALGLSAQDIAGISVFGSVAFGLGATMIGVGALAWHPHALGSLLALPGSTIRIAALALLAACFIVLAFVSTRRSEFRVRGFCLRAPSPSLMAGQFLFTLAETLCSATALYLLLPAHDLGFATFLAVFAAAVMAGVVSHVPGGVGVFETVIIAALPASVPAGQAAAGLLLYRLIYYLAPFALALVILALGELRMASRRMPPERLALLQPLFRAMSAVVPIAMAAMVFVSGAMMMAATLIPPTSRAAEDLELLLPLAFVESGALVSSALGASLLVIAHGLLRRVEGAWWLSVAVLAGGIAASLANGLDYDRAAILVLALAVLGPTKGEFYRATRLTRNVLSLRWFLLMLCLALALLAVLFFAHKATPYDSDLWWQFASDKSAPRALRAELVALVVMAVLLLRYALRPARLRTGPAPAEELERAAAIIATQPDPEACVALTGDKALFFSETGNSFVMYRVHGRSWVALHEPVGPASETATLAWAFHDAAYAANGRPVFYAVGAASAALWIQMGLALHKLGEEAVVKLPGFSLEGSHRKRLRTTYNRAKRDGLSFEVVTPPHAPELLTRLREISDAWLASKAGAEKGFSVGSFDPAYLNRTPIALIRHDDRIIAFANIWQTEAKARATLDLMRHVDDTPQGVMEFLFTELLLHYRAEGFAEFSLGNAPLSGLEARRGAPLSTQLGAFVYRHGRQFYNFEGLRSFKQKFDPDWEPVFVALPPRANLVAVATDLVALIGGGFGRGGERKSPR
ncbi:MULTISPECIES: bifunctional lysylphosphatidylglycerol flippase/synthetase MprF [Pseudooceanicola]|uniref:bifunctional lysylphosphatidylglycerol flippase/synthetase MprF n=1 Tax=Pseudooceanicola TaxID=1679449 RepID=UPI001EEFF5C1|nr:MULTISPECIES: bifunctional lysylphosphatidylglycerol flippase/synthetase MprF [Pseudooceanicola]